jgi:LysM repeat protein
MPTSSCAGHLHQTNAFGNAIGNSIVGQLRYSEVEKQRVNQARSQRVGEFGAFEGTGETFSNFSLGNATLANGFYLDGVVPDVDLDPTSRTVQNGDSLYRIAEKYYGDASYWTAIAEANGIQNPDRIQVGQQLVLPDSDLINTEVARQTTGNFYANKAAADARNQQTAGTVEALAGTARNGYIDAHRATPQQLAALDAMKDAFFARNQAEYAAATDPNTRVTNRSAYTLPARDSGQTSTLLSGVHTALDVAGLTPVLGEPADALNALLYLAEGDTLNAGLSAAGLVPFAGIAATVGRLGNRATSLIEGSHGLGTGLELASRNQELGGAVIGRIDDLKAPGALLPGEYTLLDRLTPDLGSPQANWVRNSSVLRQELSLGRPIRDGSAFRPDTELAPILPDNPTRTIRQTFTGAERNLLRNHNWTFDGVYWNPPAR